MSAGERGHERHGDLGTMRPQLARLRGLGDGRPRRRRRVLAVEAQVDAWDKCLSELMDMARVIPLLDEAFAVQRQRQPAPPRNNAARKAMKICDEGYGMAAVTARLDERGLRSWSVVRARHCWLAPNPPRVVGPPTHDDLVTDERPDVRTGWWRGRRVPLVPGHASFVVNPLTTRVPTGADRAATSRKRHPNSGCSIKRPACRVPHAMEPPSPYHLRSARRALPARPARVRIRPTGARGVVPHGSPRGHQRRA